MKHLVKKRSLGRTRDTRAALMKGLAESLVRDEKITTTEAKAKELRPYVEKLVTKAQNDTVAIRRLIGKTLTAAGVKKLVDTIAPRYKERAGGYTRIIKLPPRQSDGASMAIIEFV